jgi:hypothetical protein
VVGAVALAFATGAQAQHPAPAAKPAAGNTVSLQGAGAEQSAWINNPHMHAFYEAAKAAFANGPSKVDAAAFEKTSMAIFAEFGKSMGMKPEAMQDHLKLIPGQVVQIAKEDPKVLDSYDNFIEALMGPK